MQNVLHLPGIAIISQHVACIMLEILIMKLMSQDTTADDMASELTSDEEQAVRFTAGYIVTSLNKKLSNIPQYDDEMGDDFLSYTKEWI